MHDHFERVHRTNEAGAPGPIPPGWGVPASEPAAPNDYQSLAELQTLKAKRDADAREAYLNEPVQAALAAQARQREQALADLAASVDPALAAAVQSAAAGVQEAQAALDAARRRLADHTSAPPALMGNVTGWAKTKGQLQDEISGYESVLAARQQAHQAAAGRHRQALQGAWQRAYQGAVAELERVTAEGRQRINQAQAALDQAEREAYQHQQQAGRRVAFYEQNRPE